MSLLRKNLYIMPLINLEVFRNLLRKNQYPSRGDGNCFFCQTSRNEFSKALKTGCCYQQHTTFTISSFNSTQTNMPHKFQKILVFHSFLSLSLGTISFSFSHPFLFSGSDWNAEINLKHRRSRLKHQMSPKKHFLRSQRKFVNEGPRSNNIEGSCWRTQKPSIKNTLKVTKHQEAKRRFQIN